MTKDELIKALNFVSEERIKLQKENELLKEQLKKLRESINNLYGESTSLDIITNYEIEEI